MFANRFRCLFLNKDHRALNNSVISVNIPAINTGFTILPTPIKEVFYPGNSIEFSDLTVLFQLDEDYSNWKMIIEWMNKNKNFKSVEQETIFSDISIELSDMKKNMIYNIQLTDIFPIDISSIEFSTKIDSIEPLDFSVTFKVNNIIF